MSLSLDFTWPQTIFSRMPLSDRQRTNSKGHSQKEIFRLHLILSFNCPGYLISKIIISPQYLRIQVQILVISRSPTLATYGVKNDYPIWHYLLLILKQIAMFGKWVLKQKTEQLPLFVSNNTSNVKQKSHWRYLSYRPSRYIVARIEPIFVVPRGQQNLKSPVHKTINNINL